MLKRRERRWASAPMLPAYEEDTLDLLPHSVHVISLGLVALLLISLSAIHDAAARISSTAAAAKRKIEQGPDNWTTLPCRTSPICMGRRPCIEPSQMPDLARNALPCTAQRAPSVRPSVSVAHTSFFGLHIALLSPAPAACSALLPWHPGGREVGLEGEGMTSGGRGSGLRIGVGFHWDFCLPVSICVCLVPRAEHAVRTVADAQLSQSTPPSTPLPAGMSGPICGSPVLLAGLDSRRPTAPSSRSSTRRSLAGAVEARSA